MKKILLVLMLLVNITAFSQQQQDEKIIVSTKDLPPGVVEQLKNKQTIEKYGEWAGMGKEVGVAIRDGLTAVKDVSVDFAKTDLGMFTMVLIAYKVIGDRVIALTLAVPLMIVITLWTLWSYRKMCLPRRILVENPGFLKYPKKYQEKEAMDSGGGAAFLHFLLWAITMCILLAIAVNVG